MNNLRREREELGAPLGVVAALAHVHESRLSKGERGIVRLSPEEECRILAVLKRLRRVVESCPYPPDLRDPQRVSRMIDPPLTRAI